MKQAALLTAAALVLLVTACVQDDAAASARGSAALPPTLAQLLAEQLPALRSGMSLGEWKAAQPRDSVTLYTPRGAEQTNENWCARAETSLQLDSTHVATRTAYFYPPRTPEPPTLPAPGDRLVDQCRLGFIWVETRDRDSGRAALLLDESKTLLSGDLGPAQTSAEVYWSMSGGWRNSALWRQDELTVVTALTTEAAWSELHAPIGGTRVLLAAAGPSSDIDLASVDVAMPALWAEQQHYDAARLRQAIDLTQAGAELERPLLSFIGSLDPATMYSRGLTIAERITFIDAVDRWLSGTAPLPAPQRAAALLTADLFLQRFERAAGLGEADRASLRQRLQAHGAEFNHSPLGDYHVYTRTWLEDVRRLDPDGPAAELALLALMETGFETSGVCAEQDGRGFRAVIREGEAYLRARPDAPIAADVHFLVARAYADIVTLANGGGDGYAEAADYTAEAAVARAKALENFRTAFDRAPTSFRARESWPTAWRLLAGLTPTHTSFFCIYD